MIREPEFYNRPFQRNIEGKYGKTLPTYTVLTENSKEISEMELHPFSPKLEYQHDDTNSCCFRCLASFVHASGECVSTRDIKGKI